MATLITGATTIDAAVQARLTQRTDAGELAGGSIRAYKSAAKHIEQGIAVRLQEAATPRVDRFIATIAAASGPGAATSAHVVLRGAFALATRHGAVRTNPTTDVPRPKRPKRVRGRKAPALEEVRGIRARFALWGAGDEPRPEGDKRRRLPPASTLLDTTDAFVGTGTRTGEVLALKWDALDLGAETVIIRRTITTDRDGKCFVQEFTKTHAGCRELELPRPVVEMLLRRRVDAYSEFVFPSAVGTFRHPNNYRTVWRDALRGTDWEGVTPKSFRKTVATVLRDELGIDAAKAQLGHKDERNTTQHYADDISLGPASATVLAKLLA